MNHNFKPRPYQQHGIDLTRKAYQDGHRKIMFWLATGGGKSIIFLMMAFPFLMKNKKVLFLVRRKQLVLQAKEHFKKNGIEASVIMGTYKGFDDDKNLQIASIDTIRNRDIDFLKDFDLCIVDECHDCTADSYLNLFSKLNIKFYFGLTATPFKVGNKVHDFWETVVKPIEMIDLCEKGYLVPVELYHPVMDLSDMKKVAGDFNQGQLAEKMTDLITTGDTIELYRKHGENLPAICFCVNKEHSKIVANEFNKAGFPAIHCDESTPQDERDKAIENLKNGKIKVLCNVNIFSTGVDIPEAEVGIMARPTMSEVLYIQQVGRLLRPYRKCGKCNSSYDNSPACPICGYNKPSYVKNRAIILDQGDNTSRFGDPYNLRYAVLKKEDIKKIQDIEEINLVKTCRTCFRMYSLSLKKCPNITCQEMETVERFHKTADGELRPYNEYLIMNNYHESLTLQKNLNNYKDSWVNFKFYEKFGDKVLKYRKDFNFPTWVPRVVKETKEKELTGKVYS